jgi:hypothetical protein
LFLFSPTSWGVWLSVFPFFFGESGNKARTWHWQDGEEAEKQGRQGKAADEHCGSRIGQYDSPADGSSSSNSSSETGFAIKDHDTTTIAAAAAAAAYSGSELQR